MKYVGSKARIAKDIVPIIQKCIDDNNITDFYDCFAGGANLVQHIKCENKYAYDNNKYLIAFWKQLQNGWNPLDVEMTKDLYIKIKNNKDDYPTHIVALAGFCATYNAKWFGGYAGIVTTKIGTTRNYYDEAVRNVMAQTAALSDVKFERVDFIKNDFSITDAMVYCDPPYEHTTGYGEYFDYEGYWNKVRKLSKSNFVLCSEYHAPDDFIEIWSKPLTTTLDKSSRSESVEKLFTYKTGKYADYLFGTNL